MSKSLLFSVLFVGGPSLADFSDRTGVDIAIDAGGS